MKKSIQQKKLAKKKWVGKPEERKQQTFVLVVKAETAVAIAKAKHIKFCTQS